MMIFAVRKYLFSQMTIHSWNKLSTDMLVVFQYVQEQNRQVSCNLVCVTLSTWALDEPRASLLAALMAILSNLFIF